MREKALVKFCKMLRMANDERTPEGEREAAKARVDALVERWSFTDVEIVAQCQRELGAEEGKNAKALRAHRQRQQQVQDAMRRQAMAGMGAWATAGVKVSFGASFGACNTTTTIIIEGFPAA
jgi:hypothetical protein